MAEKNQAAASQKLFDFKCGPLKVDYFGGYYSVCYLYADAKRYPGVFVHELGSGKTFEDACRNYLRQIRGKTMVIRMPGCEWQEVQIPAEEP